MTVQLSLLQRDQVPQPSCPHCAGIGALEATDIFCGAGGSSLGLEFVCCPVCGRQLIHVTQALNHWDLAVEAHNENFPNADHDVHDVEVIPATRFRRTALLWASPECTHHAYCRGPKQTTDEAFRSRATFADIIRFTDHHHYDALIVENVIEARLWCDEPGHRHKCNCGATFDAWFQAICALGYDGQIVYFNSQFALPTPQSRDRMYVVFWRKGVRRPALDFRPPSWCSECEQIVHGVQAWKPSSKGSLRDQDGLFEWGRYGQQYLYRCPACANPVAPAVTGSKTMIDWSLPSQRIGDRDKPLADNTRRRIKVGLEYIGSLAPATVQVGGNLFERKGYARVWSVDEPLRTVLGTSHMALVNPAVTLRVGGQQPAPASVGQPMSTVTAHDRQRAIVVAGKSDTVPVSVDEAAPTVTTRPHSMLVQACHGGDARRPRSIAEPTPTVAGHGELGIVSMRNHGKVSVGETPVQSVCGGGYHHGLLVYNGVPGFVRSLEDASGTLTARDKQSLLVPYNRTGVARSTGEPSNTLTTKDREALIITDDDIDGCEFRMLQWAELLKAQVMHRLPDGSPYNLTAMRRNARGRMVELSNEQRVKMIGNAVSSPVATMLGNALVEALAA